MLPAGMGLRGRLTRPAAFVFTSWFTYLVIVLYTTMSCTCTARHLPQCINTDKIDRACPHTHAIGNVVPSTCDNPDRTDDDTCAAVFVAFYRACSVLFESLPDLSKEQFAAFDQKCLDTLQEQGTGSATPTAAPTTRSSGPVSGGFAGSTLATDAQLRPLLGWLRGAVPTGGQWVKCWSMVRAAWTAASTPQAFHAACDRYNKTVVLLTTPTGQLIGGTAMASWGGDAGFKAVDSPYQFLFSLTEAVRLPLIMGGAAHAMICRNTYGPFWGSGYDLGTGNNGAWDGRAYCGNTESHHSYASSLTETAFCGAPYSDEAWTVKAIEVFHYDTSSRSQH